MNEEYLNIGFFGDHKSGKTAWIQKLLGNIVDKNSFFDKTIDFNYNKLEIENCKKKFVIYDTPGLRKYMKTTSMIINNMDCFIIVISILDNELDYSLSKMGIFNDLLLILYTLQKKKIYIVLNKFDDSVISFSADIFNNIKKKVEHKLKQIGFKERNYEIIPISIFEDENISNNKENLNWFEGNSIIDVIKNQQYYLKNEKMPMRFVGIKFYKITGKGTVVIGFLKSGKLKKNDKVLLLPNMKESIVKSIYYFDKELEEVKNGCLVGLNIKGINLKEVKNGLILSHIDYKNSSGEVIEKLIPYHNDLGCFIDAKVIVFNHPNGVKKDTIYMMHIHSGRIPVLIKSIKVIKTSKSNKKIDNDNEDKEDFILKGCLGKFELFFLKPLKIEKFKEWDELGSFFLYDMNNPYCFGMIEKIEFKKIENEEDEEELDIEENDIDIVNNNNNRNKNSSKFKQIKKTNSMTENKQEKIEDYIPIKQNE